ncbi:hypothetical protein RBE51_18405 [Pseudomonas taiwanensis]|uniref:hypothetical protein n=1 Tax=Pseudomonas taiwanensis TaxID=470150 RepID=UPI0028DE438D|nr:hypothetical protein [Pseudomonas taiwanensis]MDT8924769.1 hypothetical protein [Pseudomonas taiwanensis]
MPQAYRLLNYNLDLLCVESPVAKNPVDVTIGRVFSYPDGILLARDPNAELSPRGDASLLQVRLTFDYQVSDLYTQGQEAGDSFLLRSATLRAIEFVDPDVQHRFGHLLAPHIAQERRTASRGECLQDLKGRRLYGVMRAMDARSRHAHAMDYVYLTDPVSLKSAAAAVVRAYETGDAPRNNLERMLTKTLEHAVTTAIYEELPQHVTAAMASSAHLFRATNEGEYFYDAPRPLKMKRLICVSQHGEVSLPAPEAKVDHEAMGAVPAR